MPKFKYNVINTANQQLQGTIKSPDEASARKELNELGFSVVSIEEIKEEITEEEEQTQVPTFEFAAIDKNKKRVAGTIQSESNYEAYKRLIKEYEFEVEYVINNDLPEKKKEKERKKGAYELHSKLEEELLEEQSKETPDEKDLKEFEKKQEALKQQIDFVLSKVKEMLDAYEENMTPATKEKLRKYVEKILRIKNSTNLDYVRKTAEELLQFLQKEELFLHKESHTKERTSMVIEAKSMMMQLKKGKSAKSADIMGSIRRWRQENIIDNENPSMINQFLDFFARLITGVHIENTEITELKREISTINGQIKHYLVLYFQAPDPEFKAQTKEGLKGLFSQRKKLKKELKTEKKKAARGRKESTGQTSTEKFTTELLSFTGWLLTFYLIYYFISIYAVSKDFGTLEIPDFLYIYKSAFLKYFLATLFLLHGALSLKVHFFRKNETASLIITPVFLIGILIIYLNF